jgi:hypothetical protein
VIKSRKETNEPCSTHGQIINLYKILVSKPEGERLLRRPRYRWVDNIKMGFIRNTVWNEDRLCGLVVRVLGYRSGGPGSIPGTTKKKVMSLEWVPLSLVSTTEELLDRKVAAPV